MKTLLKSNFIFNLKRVLVQFLTFLYFLNPIDKLFVFPADDLEP